MNTDIKTLLAGARLPERIVPLCLRGDLAAEVERLDADLEALQKQPSNSLAGNGSSTLVEQIEALQAEMREHTASVRMRALPRAQWRELAEAHPPRTDADGDVLPEDRMSGINRATFFEPLVRLSIVDSELDDAGFDALLGAITDRQFEELVAAAWELNQGKVDIPFSRAALRAKQSFASE